MEIVIGQMYTLDLWTEPHIIRSLQVIDPGDLGLFRVFVFFFYRHCCVVKDKILNILC